jgi:hypothetical protein
MHVCSEQLFQAPAGTQSCAINYPETRMHALTFQGAHAAALGLVWHLVAPFLRFSCQLYKLVLTAPQVLLISFVLALCSVGHGLT